MPMTLIVFGVCCRLREQVRARDVPLMTRLLRVAVPLKLLALCLFVAYLLYPKWFDRFGLVITPELRYVRGPPPT